MSGVYVKPTVGVARVFEFNAFLRAIANGLVDEDAMVLAEVLTDGWYRRAGDLNLFTRVRSGDISVSGLHVGENQGVLSVGPEAEVFRHAIERNRRSA